MLFTSSPSSDLKLTPVGLSPLLYWGHCPMVTSCLCPAKLNSSWASPYSVSEKITLIMVSCRSPHALGVPPTWCLLLPPPWVSPLSWIQCCPWPSSLYAPTSCMFSPCRKLYLLCVGDANISSPGLTFGLEYLTPNSANGCTWMYQCHLNMLRIRWPEWWLDGLYQICSFPSLLYASYWQHYPLSCSHQTPLGCMHACSVVWSYLTLCDSMDYGLPGSYVQGISQVKIQEWVAISSSRGSSWSQCTRCRKHWGVILYFSFQASCIFHSSESPVALASKISINSSIPYHLLSLLPYCKSLSWGFPGGSVVKNLPAIQETQV